jgi:hypothetical protein
MHKFLLLITSLFMMTACASIVTGRAQNVSVDTQGINDAGCYLSNDKGRWDVKKTPKVIELLDSYHNLDVVCVKNGYKKGKKTIASSTKGWLFGNLLLGPLFPVGMAVDIVNGAAYQYPDNISVALESFPVAEVQKKVDEPKKVELFKEAAPEKKDEKAEQKPEKIELDEEIKKNK